LCSRHATSRVMTHFYHTVSLCLTKDPGIPGYTITRPPFLTTPSQQKDWEGIGRKKILSSFPRVINPFFPQMFVCEQIP
jgi:hypothetical protein